MIKLMPFLYPPALAAMCGGLATFLLPMLFPAAMVDWSMPTDPFALYLLGAWITGTVGAHFHVGED